MIWTIRSVLAWAKGYLQDKGVDSPRLDAELLLSHALGKERIELYLDMDKPLSADELAGYRVLLKRRSHREPVAYILGRKEFFSHTFLVNRDVLIPRSETEILVEKASELAPPGSTVFEIGAGSGAVIISILLSRPDLEGLGNDVSKRAL
ncbi:MAG TPA: HemK/PrmC family methyltransferase, partial [Deltaproteobacteria bacterium]|nr:HemK/PrmC family methyltransferase [Deltaproteobacteria bacterium]